MTAVSLASLNISEQGLKSDLESRGFKFEEAEHARWRARGGSIVITLYNSGKILAQGKGAEELFKPVISTEPALLARGEIAKAQKSCDPSTLLGVTNTWKSWIGTDESGKGDYFGPLVIAGVLVNENNIRRLHELGVQDSKKMNDSVIQKIAPKIKEICQTSVITINPAKYNELYEKFKNLNSLLAWGHARVIENILEKTPCEHALSDKFGNESLIKNALMKKGRTIHLEQRTKAEDDIAVAAASVLARDEFLKRIAQFSAEYGLTLPKGASSLVLKQARAFISRYGIEKLGNVAKIHFKTTKAL